MDQLTDLVTGLGLPESVRWADDAIWFSDWTAGTVHRYDLKRGRDEVVATVRSLPLCFDVTDGRIAVLDGRRSALRLGTAAGLSGEAIDFDALGVMAANEVVRAPQGGWYLNFGNFDPARGFPATPVGVIAYLDQQGRGRLVAEGLAFPNGMALAAGGRELIVAESHAGRLTAFTLRADGGLGDRRVWAAVDGSAPDGISVGPRGTLWYADVANQNVTEVAEGGQVLRQIPTGCGAFSCCLSPDGNRLAIARARWAGAAAMFDPDHDWDGRISLLQTA